MKQNNAPMSLVACFRFDSGLKLFNITAEKLQQSFKSYIGSIKIFPWL